VPVEILAGSVVANRGPGVGVASGDLHVAQVDSGVDHRGHEGLPEEQAAGSAAFPGQWAGISRPSSSGRTTSFTISSISSVGRATIRAQ
jgi:hypothetical protein